MTRHIATLSLTLLLAGCALPGQRAFEAEVKALQNPQIPGDANRDLVAYQARQRDYSACAWQELEPTIRRNGGEYDEEFTRVFLACMAAKGWR